MAAFPQKFGRYFLVDRIASGGMAEIFKAKLIGVEGFEKTVVIKRIHPFWSQRRDFIVMLVDEAKVLVHLNHPNIVQVYELGREGDDYFICMEFVDGVDLRQVVQKLRESGAEFPYALAVKIMIESLRGLHYAHTRSHKEKGFLGIVHRDVSPQNILLSFEGEVKVTDFGIAKALTQTHETQTGVLKGKYAYMSPEQAMGKGLDFRSDLFSSGVVLYELLFGTRLFATGNDWETLEKVRQVQIPWPEARCAALPAALIECLRKALALHPQDRFASAQDFADALQACLTEAEVLGFRDTGSFLRELFDEEFRRRRIHDLEVQNRTQSFLRQTQAVRPQADDTVSLAETPTEAPAPPLQSPSPVLPPAPTRASSSKMKIAGLSLLAVMLLLLVVIGVRRYREPDLPAPAIVSAPAATMVIASPLPESRPAMPPVAAPVLPVPSTPAPKPEAKPAAPPPKPKPTGFGSLQVNAVPWGRVSVSGLVSGAETPLARGKVAAGSYRVTVSQPSLKKSVTASATVKEGRVTRCHADFEGQARISCR